MAFLDILRSLAGLGPKAPPKIQRPIPVPQPPVTADAGPGDAPGSAGPMPPEMRPTPVPAGPVAVIRLDKDLASVTTPGRAPSAAGPSGETPYRRPTRVPSGTYSARKEGNSIGLYRDGVRASGISTSYRGGQSDDLVLNYLMWRSIMDAVDSSSDPVIHVDDAYGPLADPDDTTPDAIDPGGSIQAEDDARDALGALGYETLRPDPAPDPVPPVTAVPSDPPSAPAPAPDPVPSPEVPQDTWAPSGAYGR